MVPCQQHPTNYLPYPIFLDGGWYKPPAAIVAGNTVGLGGNGSHDLPGHYALVERVEPWGSIIPFFVLSRLVLMVAKLCRKYTIILTGLN